VLHDVWLAGGFSFPSAEVTPAAAVAAGISTYYGNRWYVAIPAYAAVALVGVSRMRANAHWLSDVVGAIILGNVVARVLLWMHGLKGPDLQATPTPARLDER
jgi:membrane-associated phospholipid phosphatase